MSPANRSGVVVRTLDERRAAVAAALRALNSAPAGPTVTATGPGSAAEVAALRADVRGLLDRLSRLEDEVELLRQPEGKPLDWPVSVEPAGAGKTSVPPMVVSAGNSAAFDVLMGPPPRERYRAGRRESA